MLRVFVGSHYIGSYVYFTCCHHELSKKNWKEDSTQISRYLDTQLQKSKDKMRNTFCKPEFSCSQLNSLALMSYSIQKSKQGGLRAYLLVGNTLGYLISLLIYHQKFWTKQSLTLKIPQNCVTKTCSTPEVPGPKCKAQIFLNLGISTCFLLINLWKSHMLFLNAFGN